ncbi:uncharacterized protein LOC115781194 [Archocentrus centrarchus]|uniref:uncharacterized protein LOC115781194 n=1 Tax=Archocentrus centrarchus TaxID=63155 RepID=UPI0011EA26CE|nr:uncharacterized protein LOC115781194 [Archocentrus centrarchus]
MVSNTKRAPTGSLRVCVPAALVWMERPYVHPHHAPPPTVTIQPGLLAPVVQCVTAALTTSMCIVAARGLHSLTIPVTSALVRMALFSVRHNFVPHLTAGAHTPHLENAAPDARASKLGLSIGLPRRHTRQEDTNMERRTPAWSFINFLDGLTKPSRRANAAVDRVALVVSKLRGGCLGVYINKSWCQNALEFSTDCSLYMELMTADPSTCHKS